MQIANREQNRVQICVTSELGTKHVLQFASLFKRGQKTDAGCVTFELGTQPMGSRNTDLGAERL